MRPDQRKTRNVMIEPQLCSPIGRDMAILAPCTQLPLVYIVVAVTSAAFSWQLILQTSAMTCAAGKLAVACREREIGLGCMIEIHCTPIRHVVAAAAIRPVSALMYIIRAVTCVTVAAAKISEIVSTMAILTFNTAMPADQREAG